MGIRPGRGVLAVAVGVVALAVLAGPTLARQVVHRHDPKAFQAYVATYVDGWESSIDPQGDERDLAWAEEHTEAVLDEGNRACVWLRERRSAPGVDPSGRTSVDTLVRRYLKQTPRRSAPELPLSDEGRRTVVLGAWAYLCWWERRDKTAPRSLDPD